MKDSFAVRLLRAQAAVGLDKHEMMKRTGLSEYALRSFQTDAHPNPTMKSLVALATVLEVSIDYLCGLTETP